MYAKKPAVTKKPVSKAKAKPTSKVTPMSLYRRKTTTVRRRRPTRYRHRRSHGYRRHAYGHTKLTIIKPHGDCILSDRVATKLRYSKVLSLTGILANGVDTNIFSINGPQDPDGTSSTNAQPRFWDQYTTFYNRYRCYGCKVEITFNSLSANSIGVAIGGIDPSDSGILAPVDFNDACEQNYRTLFINSEGSYKIKRYFDPAAAWGVSRLRYKTDDQFQAQVTTIPSWKSNFFVLIQNFSSETTANINYHIKITYYTNFFSPKTVAPSLVQDAIIKLLKAGEHDNALKLQNAFLASGGKHEISDIESDNESDTTEIGLDQLTKSDMEVIKKLKSKK